ncbi:hypothetical protein ACQPYH_12510 [Kribbella sp. CA-245084]|uniref:hypothetical protein n=1 Tax=Kribbella sp. CA-245084 TaxID=3239940 RepID=UPI003D8F10B0
MTPKGIRSRAGGVVAAAGALTLLLGATTLLVAPSANADQAVVAGGNKGNPPGNNGTVKIEGADIQSGPPDNNPHQGCTFVVEFYNYDKNPDYFAKVTFEDQAPTKDGGLQVVSGNLSPFIGEDAAGGGTDLDARETYTLKFTGQPQPQQGYHVKLTVDAPGSIGADKKHKVFWVSGCDAPPTTTPPTKTPCPTKTPTKPPTTSPPTTTAPTTPPATTKPPTTVPTTAPPSTPATTTAPPATTTGTPSDTPPTATTTATTPVPDVPGESQTPAPGVPTEVDAGFGGANGTAANSVAGGNSPFGLAGGLLLVAGGLMLAGGGVVALRRRGKHSV